ncbi:hypothetical protein B0H19DRAFT_1232400 [Mycena capillaripes]|nr:hypothetical protein B0H19DRAFT_1232400 [Mycena capillaripes]
MTTVSESAGAAVRVQVRKAGFRRGFEAVDVLSQLLVIFLLGFGVLYHYSVVYNIRCISGISSVLMRLQSARRDRKAGLRPLAFGSFHVRPPSGWCAVIMRVTASRRGIDLAPLEWETPSRRGGRRVGMASMCTERGLRAFATRNGGEKSRGPGDASKTERPSDWRRGAAGATEVVTNLRLQGASEAHATAFPDWPSHRLWSAVTGPTAFALARPPPQVVQRTSSDWRRVIGQTGGYIGLGIWMLLVAFFSGLDLVQLSFNGSNCRVKCWFIRSGCWRHATCLGPLRVTVTAGVKALGGQWSMGGLVQQRRRLYAKDEGNDPGLDVRGNSRQDGVAQVRVTGYPFSSESI